MAEGGVREEEEELKEEHCEERQLCVSRKEGRKEGEGWSASVVQPERDEGNE